MEAHEPLLYTPPVQPQVSLYVRQFSEFRECVKLKCKSISTWEIEKVLLKSCNGYLHNREARLLIVKPGKTKLTPKFLVFSEKSTLSTILTFYFLSLSCSLSQSPFVGLLLNLNKYDVFLLFLFLFVREIRIFLFFCVINSLFHISSQKNPIVIAIALQKQSSVSFTVCMWEILIFLIGMMAIMADNNKGEPHTSYFIKI